MREMLNKLVRKVNGADERYKRDLERYARAEYKYDVIWAQTMIREGNVKALFK